MGREMSKDRDIDPKASAVMIDEETIEIETQLIDMMVAKARDDEEKIHCIICGCECEEGEYSISLMGHGARCSDAIGCVASFERDVREGSGRVIQCFLCFTGRPVEDVNLSRSRIVRCIDQRACREVQVELGIRR